MSLKQLLCLHYWVDVPPKGYAEYEKLSTFSDMPWLSFAQPGAVWECLRCKKRIVKRADWVPFNYISPNDR